MRLCDALRQDVNPIRVLLLATCAAGVAPGAHGQTSSQAPGQEIEEIVVTATKRKERLLDVPMSITAVTGRAIADQGATGLRDIAATIPGLSLVENAPGQQRVQIRGISSTSGLPTIGVYLDELPINVDSVAVGLDMRLLDLERIEVLRGPQGTLYGEGSMGGTLKYITRNPKLDAWDFAFESAYGSVKDGGEDYRASIVANLPVVENVFGIRAVAGYEHDAGWIAYPLASRDEVNEGESKTARLKALWNVSERLSASLSLMSQQGDYDSQAFADAQRNAPYVIEQPYDDEAKLASLVLNFAANGFDVLSATGYLDRTVDSTFDVSGFFIPVFGLFGIAPDTVQSVGLVGVNDYEALTQEIRIASTGSGPLTWTAGVYYRDYEENTASTSVTTPTVLPFEAVESQVVRDSRQSAVFGEMNYAWTPRWETTLGLRYFRDERSGTGSSANFGFPAQEPESEETFTSINPRAVLSYRPVDGKLFYISAAKGFRSGGFNFVASRPPGCELSVDFEPEKLWTYEFGSIASFANGRFVFQGAVYHNDWRDIQTPEFCPGTQIGQTANVGKASGAGVDVQLTVNPLDTLAVTLSGSYNDSQYDDTSASHFEGDTIDYVPQTTAGLTVDWRFDWASSLPGRFHVDYQYTDDYTIALRNFPGMGLTQSDVIRLLNARLAAEFGDWEIALYGHNLTDVNDALAPPVGVILVPISAQPRTIGVGMRYNY